MFSNELSYKIIKIEWNNSPKIEFWFFETQIWYAWSKLRKSWMIIMQHKKY